MLVPCRTPNRHLARCRTGIHWLRRTAAVVLRLFASCMYMAVARAHWKFLGTRQLVKVSGVSMVLASLTVLQGRIAYRRSALLTACAFVKDVREAFVRHTGEDSPEFSGRAVYSYSVLYGEEIASCFLLAFDQRTTTSRPPFTCWSTMSPGCIA